MVAGRTDAAFKGGQFSPLQYDRKTDTDTDTDTGNDVKTGIHTVFLNTETVKTVESPIFQHTDEKTGNVIEMGEGEILRRLRVYETRVLETETRISEINPNDFSKLEKQYLTLENRKQAVAYWKTALQQVTEKQILRAA